MRPIGISPAQGKRIVKAVRGIERSYNPDQRQRTPVALWNPGVVRAVVTTAIPTGTFSTPSTSGAAQIYHKDASGVWAASGDPVVVNNQYVLTASVAVSKSCHLSWCDGDWWLIAMDCP
ncbi:hypothetical protein [Paludisphaera borealis]|uniref:Uncharacterized protein n=1 Tax=Paludisphaera borealis TaxID=1387353 RepID=A0A1U7CNH9_9BACT|nr:hypothetical protein [Paludisphaera borealis]APW60492.1 hypothetical protein BSF38_01962 [Paludisphaera borealis]